MLRASAAATATAIDYRGIVDEDVDPLLREESCGISRRR
jgi:hypothetical protein